MAEPRVVPSDLFPLVFAFLRDNHFEGAARAFGRAAGVTDQDPNAASLLDVFNYWLKSPDAKKRKAVPNGPPAKKSKKESSSSSDESSSEEDEKTTAKKPEICVRPQNDAQLQKMTFFMDPCQPNIIEDLGSSKSLLLPSSEVSTLNLQPYQFPQQQTDDKGL